MNDLLIPAPILIPLATAFILPVVRRVSHSVRALFCITAMTLTLLCLLALAQPVFNGEILVYWMSGWQPRDGLAVGISLVVDAWSLLIALVVAVIGLMSLIYSTVYMNAQSGRGSYYVLTMLLLTGLIGFCLSGDLFNQFVWLEVFSFAGFALTGFHIDNRLAVEAAFKYLITNSVAAFFIAIGLTLLYAQTGALNLAEVAAAFQATPAGLAAIGLLIGGYATKAALTPWHFWLPDAHAVAPSPISALFSGALIKVGIYAIGRIIFTLVPFQPGSVIQTGLLVVAAVTIFLGGLQMMQQQSIKRILAFSSVSQMGYIVMGLALGTPLSLAAAAIHVISHALLKSTLFMGAGLVSWRTGIHSVSEGGGLARYMPLTCVAMVLAGLGLSGVPFFSAFISKTMLEEAGFETGSAWIAWVIVLSSVFTFAGMARLLWGVFGPRRTAVTIPTREAPLFAILPLIVLVLGSLIVGLFPAQVASRSAWPAAEALLDRETYIDTVLAGEAVMLLAPPSAPIEPHSLPDPFAWEHWGIPTFIILAGTLLTYALFNAEAMATWGWLRPVWFLAALGRRWHSGLVMDYVMWNAFGTAVSAFVIVIANRLGN